MEKVSQLAPAEAAEHHQRAEGGRQAPFAKSEKDFRNRRRRKGIWNELWVS